MNKLHSEQNGVIGVGEWAEGMVRDIQRFADDWQMKNDDEPRDYPCQMQKSDWDKQFNVFAQRSVLR